MNAVIADESSDANAIFFNEAMTQMLYKNCQDMVITHGYSDPDTVPLEILHIRGKRRIFEIAMKRDGTMAINKAIPQPTLEPVTPNPKSTAKKQVHVLQGIYAYFIAFYFTLHKTLTENTFHVCIEDEAVHKQKKR